MKHLESKHAHSIKVQETTLFKPLIGLANPRLDKTTHS